MLVGGLDFLKVARVELKLTLQGLDPARQDLVLLNQSVVLLLGLLKFAF